MAMIASAMGLVNLNVFAKARAPTRLAFVPVRASGSARILVLRCVVRLKSVPLNITLVIVSGFVVLMNCPSSWGVMWSVKTLVQPLSVHVKMARAWYQTRVAVT